MFDKTRFSKLTGCFYPLDIAYASLPADVIEVPISEFDTAMSRKSGDTLDVIDGHTVVVPAPPVDYKAFAWHGIKAERDRRKAGGVKVGAKWFHSDDGSRIQQMGLVMMGAAVPANLQWKTMDGSFIAMTQTLASQVFQAVAASDQTIFAAAEMHKAAMEASADPASYDYSSGWPKVYGE